MRFPSGSFHDIPRSSPVTGRARRRCMLGAAALVAATITMSAQPEPPENPSFTDVTVHDPSVLKVGSLFYVFGSHLASARTSDWLRWTQVTTDTQPTGGNALVPNPQVELDEALAWVGAGGAFWAPDVIQLPDGRYYYYYCIGRLDQPRAALGLAVSDDIDGPYVDLGIMLRSGAGGQPDGIPSYDARIHPNTVDPDVFFDQDGKYWMVYGSYSGGIFILEMDPATGFPLPGQGYGKKLIGGQHSRIEGAFIVYSPETDYYYMFVSFGGLGANDGYNIRMGRSRQPDGPYLDAAGNDLTNVSGAPGSLFDDESIQPFGVKVMGNWRFVPVEGEPAQSVTGYRSPGHNSAYYDPESGKYFLVFHTRFAGTGEQHQVRVHQMYMNADGWLVAAPHRYAGETLTLQHRNQVPGDYKVIRHDKIISGQIRNSQLMTFEPDGRIAGAGTGTWRFRHDNDVTIVLDGETYRGIFSTQWDDENGTRVHAFSAISEDGVSLWGSRTVVSKHGAQIVPLSPQEAVYGETFVFELPPPAGNPADAYSYEVLEGPGGLTVGGAGVVSWEPTLLQAEVPFDVVIRAVKTQAGDPDQVEYSFTLTAVFTTVVERVELDFSSSGAAGVQDVNGVFTGFTTRLPGTGGALPAFDPNLVLDTASGVLQLKTTQSDINFANGLDVMSAPGVSLADLGVTGNEDFAVTVVFRPLAGLQLIDQVGLYVGTSTDAVTRAGTIVFGAPERYSVHSENGGDHSGRFFGFGLDVGDGMTVTITRQDGVWRYFVDEEEWNPLTSPDFLDGAAGLVAGVFGITPLNNTVKTVEVESFTVVVDTGEPLP